MKNRKNKKIFEIKLMPLILIIIFVFIISKIIIGYKQSKDIISPEISKSLEYDTVKDGDNKTNSEYVTFDAFFLKDLNNDGIAESIRGTCDEIGKEDTLYFELRVNDNGYLKDGVITIDSKNFYFNTAIVKDSVSKKNYINYDTKKIELNTVQNGTQKLFTGIVRSGNYSDETRKYEALKSNINNYSKVNSITLTGTHVSDDNVETKITKKVDFNVDWYGTTVASIEKSNIENKVSSLSKLYDENNVNLSFKLTTSEDLNELLLKEAYIEGTMPEVNGYKPIKVEVTGDDVTSEYDENTRIFKANRTATVDSNGNITKECYDTNYYNYNNVDESKRFNEWTVNVVYPKEAFTQTQTSTIELIIPVKAIYKGYNNSSRQFTNPYISNEVLTSVVATWKAKGSGSGSGDGLQYDVEIGKWVQNPYQRRIISKAKPSRIYNLISENEKDDFYETRWTVYSGSTTNKAGINLSENKKGEHSNKDKFIKEDGTKISMEDYTSNVGIYFNGINSFLGKNGWLKIYNDDTGAEIVTLTADTWNEKYMYDNPVKHIRIETSNITASHTLVVYNIKQLDDEVITNDFSLAEFEELEHIETTLVGYYGESNPTIMSSTANYETPYSFAKLSASKNSISTQQTDENPENEVLTITTMSSNSNEQKWKNGIFLIKMPEDVININKINSVTSDNPSVEIESYDLFEENGIFYIRIETKNNEETTYNINVDFNICPNPKIPTKTETFELYAKNEIGSSYLKRYASKDIYDVDSNGNTEETVNKNTANISFISPNNILTNQQARNYDKVGSVTVAPRVAKTDKEQRTASIDVAVTNNYTSEITDVLIQGVIPFKGNKYILSDWDLGSEFDTTMVQGGISIDVKNETDKDISSTTKIYYSTLEKPTNDLSNQNNMWVPAEEVTDWSKIKSYIIDLGSYRLQKEETHVFSYEINIPDGLEYNQTSYSEHGIYFALVTDEGKYYTSTSVNKLGFMIAKQYDLEIQKYQKDTNKKLEGISFKIQEEGNTSSTVRKTNANGIMSLGGLYTERKYIIKEFRTTEDYVLNNEEIELYTYTDNEDNLYVGFKNEDGSYTPLEEKYSFIKSANIVKEENSDYKLIIEFEDVVKARLKVSKKNEGTPLKSVKFKLSGKDINDLILQTDENGYFETKGLIVGETYTLTEVKADGYYVNSEPIKFKIESSNTSGFNLQYIENENIVLSSNIEINEQIPTINMEFENEKIPTYSLELSKYAKHEEGEEEKTLEGAQFILKGDGISDNGITLTTDENGIVKYDGLYEYVEENGVAKGNISGEYTLEEIYAPSGYAIDNVYIKFKAQKDEQGNLQLQIIEGQDKVTKSSVSQENNKTKVNFSIENPPIFELLKTDENNNPIEGVKFEILSIDENQNTTPAKDIEGNYVGQLDETVNKYICTTNASGKIVLNLPEGLYKAVEIETNENYELPEKESDRTQYFGIGKTQSPESEFKLHWTDSLKGSDIDTINSIKSTSDGGIIAVGSFYSTATLKQNENSTITAQGYKDGIIIKYDEDGSVEWTKVIGGNGNDELTKVIQTSDEGYIIAGNIQSSNITIGNETLNTIGMQDTVLIKLDKNGNYEWNKHISGDTEQAITSIYEDNNKNIIITGEYFSSTLKIPNGNSYETLENLDSKDSFVASYSSNGNSLNWYQLLRGDKDVQAVGVIGIPGGYVVAINYLGTAYLEKTNTQELQNLSTSSASNNGFTWTQDAALVWYNSDGTFNKKLRIGGTTNDKISGIINYNDGILAYGTYTGSIDANSDGTNDFTSKGMMDNYIFKYSTAGDYQPDESISFGGTLEDDIVQIDSYNNSIFLGGWTYGAAFDINGDGTNDVTPSGNNCDSYIAKLDSNSSGAGYVVDKAYRQYGTGYDEAKTVCTTNDGGFAIGGLTNSSTLTVEGPNSTSITNTGTTDGFIAKYSNVITSPEISKKQKLLFVNEFKKHNITTTIYSVDKDNNKTYDEGGTVVGNYGIYENINYSQENHIKYVESVKYDQNSTEEIVVVPEEDYVVTSILINGEKYSFEPDNEGKVIIPVFENVQTDKHIDIELAKDSSQIIVKHLLWNEEQGETETEVAATERQSKPIGAQYTTNPNTDIIDYEIITNKDFYGDKTEQEVCEILNVTNITDLNYENFEEFQNDYYIPQNAAGTFKEETQTIKYLYKEKTYSLTVEHLIYGTDNKVPDTAGNDIEAIYTDGYKKYVDDTITPESKYETSESDKVDYSKYELVADSGNTSGTITKDTVVKYYYDIKDASNVIVHHYIVGTEEKVPSKEGSVVDDQVYPENGTAKVGDEYETNNASDSISQNYKVATNKDVYGDELPTELVGKENEAYVPENYKGIYQDQEQVVIYYYVLETPEVINNINKTITKEFTNNSESDGITSYRISYTANVNKYIGDATITIIDTLPYEIDTDSEYDLNGGEYDKNTKTITWKELIKDINTYENEGTKNIAISKNIRLKYKAVLEDDINIKNTVEGSILLIETNTKSDKVYDEVVHSFDNITSITVNKVWEDNNDSLNIRPDSVKVRLKATIQNGNLEDTEYNIPDSISKEVELRKTVGNENGDNWTYTWEELEKYDQLGNKINYSVEELPLEGNLGIIYKADVSKDKNNPYAITIKNTYVKPTEKILYQVEKVWDDNNNENGKRPEKLEIDIYKEGENRTIATHELSTISETKYTFELDKYDEKGNEIKYTAEEKAVNANDLYFYELSNIDRQGLKTVFTNKFTVPDEKVSVTVSKIWNDSNNKYNKRPNSIRIVLNKIENESEVEVQEHILKVSDGEESYVFSGLQKYDQKGNEINYIVSEQEVNSGDLKYYNSKTVETKNNEFTITNEFIEDKVNINIEAEKLWDDNNNEYGKRPQSIILNLMNGKSIVQSKVVSQSTDWKTVFENVAKYDNSGNEIKYTIEEDEVNDGDLDFYTISSEGTMTNSDNRYKAEITNRLNVPSDTKDIKVIKTWNDNNQRRLDKITLVLTGNGETYKHQLTSENQDENNSNLWEYTFKDLPKFNESGEEIEYILSEEETNKGDLRNYIQTVDGYNITNKSIVTNQTITKNGTKTIMSLGNNIKYTIDYEVNIDRNYKGKSTITITDQLPYEIDTDKQYDLHDGEYDAENKIIVWTGTYDPNSNSITWKNGELESFEEQDKIKISKDITFFYKDIDLDNETIKIKNVAIGKVELENGYSEEVNDSANTNVEFKYTVKVTKVWKGNSINRKPVKIKLKYGKESKTITLDSSNSWTYEFTDLPKYDLEGKEIEYSVTEENVPAGYYEEILKEEINPNEPNKLSFIITNYKYGSITITKVDKNDENKKLAGAEFTIIKLKEENGKWVEDKSFESKVVTTSDKGIATFDNLQYGKYKVKETKAPNGYRKDGKDKEFEINENNQEYNVKITNSKNRILPMTGETEIIGLAIVSFVILAIIFKKKSNKEF